MAMQLDVHTHTLASGHAYGTIAEMCRAARDKGLALLGITEHTSGIPGTCDDFYFVNFSVVPRRWEGVRLLLGAEINIVDYEGTLDLSEYYMKRIDLRIAGIHSQCYRFGTMAQNTAAVLGAIQNPYVHIISHPDDGNCPLDYKAVVDAAARHDVLLEINNNALRSPGRKDSVHNSLTLLRLCRQRDYPVLLSSDAHFMADVANVALVLPLLREANFPDELVINYDLARFDQFLRRKEERLPRT
ncbi:MAG: phosphatase [Clostridiales bacterium]|nr:phosphatase [Clostridiales bacterium]